LYDLKADPAETRDVAAKHPDVVKRFDEYLRTARTDSEIWPIRENKRAAGSGNGGDA